MTVLKAFHGLLPLSENAAQVSAVPYDVVNSQEAAALAAGNPLSFLHVSRPEIDLPEGVNLYSDEMYAKAAANFAQLCQTAPLKMDAEAHVYLYRLTMGSHRQSGIAAAFSADEYLNGMIKKHEKTRQDKEDDRARHVMTLRSQTGPVFLTYRDSAAVDALVEAEQQKTPMFDFISADGVRHEMWRVPNDVSILLTAAFQSVPALYIADGHHRAAAGCRAAQACRDVSPSYTGTEEFNYFLAVAFPASQLRILPYNRVVKDLNGMSKETFLSRIEENFTVTPSKNAVPETSGTFQMYLNGTWFTVKPKFETAHFGVIEQLDVSLLQDYVLAPLLDIQDPRTSKRIDFVGGIRGTTALEARVDSGECAVAFSMFPTTLDQLMAVSDAGAMMPPKSTWFEPKLRDGLVCHNF